MEQKFVTLPREVAERALKSMLDARCSVYDGFEYDKAATALAAAMQQTPAPEQPQNHVPDAGNMAPAGWKLVPVEPTNKMAGEYWKYNDRTDVVMRDAWDAMLAAAPKPPVVEQQQVEQEPALVVAYDKQGWRQMFDDMREIPDGTPLYTHPQPKRGPLTDEQIDAVYGDTVGYSYIEFARAIEAAHNIK